MAAAANSKFRRQLRTFAVVWAGMTLALGALTFIAIYLAYDALAPEPPEGGDLRSVAIPIATTAVAQAPTTTPIPTLIPTAVPDGQVSADSMAATVTMLAATRDAARGIRASATPAVEQALPTTAVSPTPLPIDVKRFQLGVQVQVSYDNMGQWMDVAANQLGVRWVKQQVRWEDIEPERDSYDWFYTDTFLPAARDRGLKVLVSVVTAPTWAREPGVDTSRHGPPADPNDYANFVVDLIRRYPGMIHAVEVWNEQNLDREWTSARGLNAADYVTLLRTTYQAIKAVDPGIIVISGALSPTGLSDGVRAWDDFTYMDQLIAAGMLNYTDCVGAHHNGINVSPDYTWDAIPNDPTAIFRGPFDNPHHSWSFRSTLQTYASKIQLAGGRQKLCVTEFGWPSAEGLDGIPQGFDFARDNSLAEQRDYTVRALQNMVEWDIVQIAILWNLNYGPQAGWAVDNDNVAYSIIGPGFVFRPVFDAVRDWNRAYEAQFQ